MREEKKTSTMRAIIKSRLRLNSQTRVARCSTAATFVASLAGCKCRVSLRVGLAAENALASGWIRRSPRGCRRGEATDRTVRTEGSE